MKRLGMGSFAALALLGVFAAGCQSPMHDENLKLHQQNRELQNQLSQSQAEMAARDARMRDMERQMNERPATAPAPVVAAPAPAPAPSGMSSLPSNIEVRQDIAAGTVTVNVPGDVLFDSGKAELNSSAKATLAKIANVLKREYPGKAIRVEGHTDSDPIVHSKWRNNTELSNVRAEAVANYLGSQGVKSEITTKGFGDTHPRGSDKQKNRRVEIVVVTR
jgi:flagellar motor protein MotB